MKERSNPESEDGHKKNVADERESASYPRYWVAAMYEKKAMAIECQELLRMLTHINPFARKW